MIGSLGSIASALHMYVRLKKEVKCRKCRYHNKMRVLCPIILDIVTLLTYHLAAIICISFDLSRCKHLTRILGINSPLYVAVNKKVYIKKYGMIV